MELIFFIRLVTGQDYLHQHFFILLIFAFVFTYLSLPSLLPHYHHLAFFFHQGTSNNNLFCYILQSIFHFSLSIVLINITVLGNSFIQLLIKLVNSDTCVLFRVSAPEYPDPMIIGSGYSRISSAGRSWRPFYLVILGQVDSLSYLAPRLSYRRQLPIADPNKTK
jgi:hypothetical protein